MMNRNKLTAALFAFALLGVLALGFNPVIEANTPEAEAAMMEPTTVFVCGTCGDQVDGFHQCEEPTTIFACGNCGEEVNSFHVCGEVKPWHCDSCGEETTDAPQARKFDDNTIGKCCEYCAAFFTLDPEDREAIRASWA